MPRRHFRYEVRSQPPIPPSHFVGRVVAHAALAGGLVGLSLGIGMSGYIGFEDLSLTDAFLNASMLLGGMGPVDLPRTEAGKLFAGAYALYAGLVFLIVAGIVLAPVLHRLLHRFHWDDDA
jgi:hypothetical protein